MLKRLLFVTIATVAMGACAAPAPPAPAAPPDTSADEAKLKSDLTKWFADFNAGNTDAVASQYAADAVLMPPNAPAAAGTDAIKKTLAGMSAEMKPAGLALNSTGTPALGVTGDMAWMQGTYNVTDAKGTTVEVGKFLSVHRKTNGQWLYIRDTWNSDSPPPPPAPAKKK
jgi:ketosteroid isomerase-like protein